jgi:hypothetical protein
MATRRILKRKYPTKLVRVNANTWIETKVDIPDEVAREKFLLKLSLLLKPQPVDQNKNLNPSSAA